MFSVLDNIPKLTKVRLVEFYLLDHADFHGVENKFHSGNDFTVEKRNNFKLT